MDLALNNLQMLICHKTKPNQTNDGAPQRILLCVTNFVHYFLYLSRVFISNTYNKKNFIHHKPSPVN